MKNKIFTPENIWYGGYYELAIEIGKTGNDTLLDKALNYIWNNPNIIGPYSINKKEPYEQNKINYSLEEKHFYGYITLANKYNFACATYSIREEDNGSDWLDFIIPVGSITKNLGEKTDPCLYKNNKIKIIDNFYLEIITELYNECPFKLALIGHEMSGMFYSESISENDWNNKDFGVILPLNHKLLQSCSGVKLNKNLIWNTIEYK